MPKVTPRGKISQAWKTFEKQVADFLLEHGIPAERKSRGGDFGEEDFDIEILGLPFLKIDAKYQSDGWHHHTVLEKQVIEKYCEEPGDEPIMPTKAGKQRGFYVTITDKLFVFLLKLAFYNRRTKDGEWACNNCGTPYTIERRVAGSLNKFTCPSCHTVIFSEYDPHARSLDR